MLVQTQPAGPICTPPRYSEFAASEALICRYQGRCAGEVISQGVGTVTRNGVGREPVAVEMRRLSGKIRRQPCDYSQDQAGSTPALATHDSSCSLQLGTTVVGWDKATVVSY